MYLVTVARLFALIVALEIAYLYFVDRNSSHEAQFAFWLCSKNTRLLYNRTQPPCSAWNSLKAWWLLDVRYEHDMDASFLLTELAEFAERCDPSLLETCPTPLLASQLFYASNCIFWQTKLGDRNAVNTCSEAIEATPQRVQFYFWLGLAQFNHLNITKWVEKIPPSMCCHATVNDFADSLSEQERMACAPLGDTVSSQVSS
jgi:hypothetical protein